MKNLPPVITIDGSSGVGKGTIALLLANKLGWHILDSGALYRVSAWAMLHYHVNIEDEEALAAKISQLQIRMFLNNERQGIIIHCDELDVSDVIRMPECAILASKIAAKPAVRTALLSIQRAQRRLPGLVTDGRDMGTIVFPDALVKFFFTADIEERAKRRCKELKQKGINVSLPTIREQLAERDLRDSQRTIAPLQPADDAIMVDTTHSSVAAVLDQVWQAASLRI